MNTSDLIHALGGPVAVANACDQDITKQAVSAWGARDEIPMPWQKFLRLKLGRKPEHKAAWASYDQYLIDRAKPPQGGPAPESMASQS